MRTMSNLNEQIKTAKGRFDGTSALAHLWGDVTAGSGDSNFKPHSHGKYSLDSTRAAKVSDSYAVHNEQHKYSSPDTKERTVLLQQIGVHREEIDMPSPPSRNRYV